MIALALILLEYSAFNFFITLLLTQLAKTYFYYNMYNFLCDENLKWASKLIRICNILRASLNVFT